MTTLNTIQARLVDGLHLLDAMAFRLSVQCGGSDPTDPRCQFDAEVANHVQTIRQLFREKLADTNQRLEL